MGKCKHYDYSCKKEEMTCEGCAYCSADELFEDLGYKKHIDGNRNIDYYRYKTLLCENDTKEIIRFYINSKEIGANQILTIEEFRAIAKKVEEMQW